jgi:predicted DNA-binding transcriptional regulator AlpA
MTTHGGDAGRVVPAALSAADAAAYLGLSRASVWRMTAAGALPRPVMLSPGRRAWLRVELDLWLEQRRAERDGGLSA